MRNLPVKYENIYRMVSKHGVWLHDNDDGLVNCEMWVFDGKVVSMNHNHKIGRFIDDFFLYQENRRAWLKKKAKAGCGKMIGVIGTNGGKMPCGALLDGKPYYCDECKKASTSKPVNELLTALKDITDEHEKAVALLTRDGAWEWGTVPIDMAREAIKKAEA